MGTGDAAPPTLAPAPAPSGGSGTVGAPAQSCQAPTVADLRVTVTRRGDNAPVQGVRVSIRGPRSRSGRTDRTGVKLFRGLRPGNYTVTGAKRHYSTESTNANVVAGPVNQAALQLTAQTELEVTVTETHNRDAIEAATVHITGPSAPADVATDRRGVARFRNINVGDYAITATKERHRQPTAVNVRVEPGRTPARVRLQATSRLHGTVTDRESRSPIEGATITLRKEPEVQVQTNADGNYDFGVVDVGDYRVVAHRDGFRDVTERVRMVVQAENRADLRMEPSLRIAPNRAALTVVLDTAGNAPGGHPVLSFTITGGPPNYLFDVQVQRGGANGLSGGPGLGGAWNSAGTRQNRLGQRLFSSWTNGDQALRLDGNGAATYTMPLEWWRDLARQPLASFTTERVHYRVLAFPTAASASKVYSTTDARRTHSPHLELRNNLMQFRVYRLRYHPDGATAGRWRRFARIEFRVREANTRNMYNMVQWKQGGRTWEDGSVVSPVQDYDQLHGSNYPTTQIDRVHTNPRYWDGVPTDATTRIAFYTDDVSIGPVPAPHTRITLQIDFISKMHVDFDIPAAVTIDAAATTNFPDGSLNVYRGTIDETQTLILADRTWNAHMRVDRNATTGAHTFRQL